MTAAKFRPGAKAPRTGAYTVTHRAHRLSHVVLMDEGTEFPLCRKCGDDVRYELYMRIQRIELDRDLAPTPSDEPARPKVLAFRHPKVG